MMMNHFTWVQPTSQTELLQRLADARDLAVDERERENLCACAHTEIERLQRVVACLSRYEGENDEAMADWSNR